MTQKELDIKALHDLKNGECYVIPESDYGKAEIWLINNAFFIFEIPMFGGEPYYVDNYSFTYEHSYPVNKQKVVKHIINLIYSWT